MKKHTFTEADLKRQGGRRGRPASLTPFKLCWLDWSEWTGSWTAAEEATHDTFPPVADGGQGLGDGIYKPLFRALREQIRQEGSATFTADYTRLPEEVRENRPTRMTRAADQLRSEMANGYTRGAGSELDHLLDIWAEQEHNGT